MEKIKGVILDLDGTLLDSMWVWEQIDIDFLARRGLQVPEDYVDAITPMGFYAAAEYTIHRFGFSQTPEEIIEEWKEMSREVYASEVLCKKYVREALEFFQKNGIHMTIATASHEELFIPCLKNNGIWEYFDSYSTMSEVKRGKGFPDIYELAAKKIQCEPHQVIVFEDIVQGVQGARMGGFCTVGVHDSYSQHDEVNLRREADYYMMDWSQLPAIYEEIIKKQSKFDHHYNHLNNHLSQRAT